MITLTMIVKNEAHIIARCLASARPFIDRFCIVDTGSTDNTVEEIRKALDGIPGDVHHVKWQGFGHARSEALRRAGHEGYALCVDADEVLSGDPTEFRASLTAESMGVWLEYSNIRYRVARVFDLARPWRYEGVLHEYPTTDGPHTEGDAELKIALNFDSARAIDPRKYHRDAEVLEEALRTETNAALASRYRFYLAQSYRDSGNDELAEQNYLIRATLGGGLNVEEVYVSLLEAGRAAARLGKDPAPHLLRAHQSRPQRAEALYELAFQHRRRDQFELAYIYASAAAKIPLPADRLFVEHAVYAWRALDELAVSAFWSGRKDESAAVCARMLTPGVPEEHAARIRENLRLSRIA